VMSNVNMTNFISSVNMTNLTSDLTSQSHELNVCVAMEYRLRHACLDESCKYAEFDESCT